MASTQFSLNTSDVTNPGVPASATEDDAVAEAQKNNLEFSRIRIPDNVAAGEDFRISGEYYVDAIIDITDIDTRLVFTVAGQERTVEGPKLGAGESTTFSESFTAPNTPDQAFDVIVEAQVDPPEYIPGIPSGGWTTKERRMKTVNSVTSGEKTALTIRNYAPYIAGGGGTGYALASYSGRDAQTGALAGAAVGAAAKRYGYTFDRLTGLAPTPVEAVAYAALLGTGAWFLTRGQDVTGIGEGAGGVIRSGASRAARAIRR